MTRTPRQHASRVVAVEVLESAGRKELLVGDAHGRGDRLANLVAAMVFMLFFNGQVKQ